ncbi:DUF7556 family protein [Haladaptatus halobius]|uniref:DUF7556 family protein n=1 Tax=Haladaptatus halobius TaxID=2884875 RepID=UPI001D0B55DD|nr:hypothetical protein [Haladaptatus halobius]
MTPDTAAVSVSVADSAEVMASVDDDGRTERLVIADISREDAWISMRMTDAASLSDWQ